MGRLAAQALEGLRLAGRGARLAAREPGDALLALRMAAWVAAISLGGKLLPLPTALRLATPLRRRPPRADAAEVQARTARVLDALLAADFLCFTPTCWKRAPVLYRFLALKGVESRVLFGVRKGQDGGLDGHAWVESGGEPVVEKTAPDFNVTFSYPA